MKRSEDFANGSFGLHVAVIGCCINVVETARENTLLNGVIHKVVIIVIWVTHVRSIPKSSDFEIGIEGAAEVLVVHFEAVEGVVLTTTVVAVSAFSRAVASERLLFHEVDFLHISVLLLVHIYVLQEISYFALNWVDAGANFVFEFSVSD
jgi:hypothetical protein